MGEQTPNAMLYPIHNPWLSKNLRGDSFFATALLVEEVPTPRVGDPGRRGKERKGKERKGRGEGEGPPSLSPPPHDVASCTSQPVVRIPRLSRGPAAAPGATYPSRPPPLWGRPPSSPLLSLLCCHVPRPLALTQGAPEGGTAPCLLHDAFACASPTYRGACGG